jgi:hypothetical protein
LAKKKKKDDGLKEFGINYSSRNSAVTLTGKQRAIDKHDAILKFKQLNPDIRVKDAVEIIKLPDSVQNDTPKHYMYATHISEEYPLLPPTLPGIMVTSKHPDKQSEPNIGRGVTTPYLYFDGERIQ